MIIRLISFILFFIFSFSFSFNNEIRGKFIYDTDINKNELERECVPTDYLEAISIGIFLGVPIEKVKNGVSDYISFGK